MQASTNPALLQNSDSVRLLSNVLKTNVSACTSIGGEAYTPQIARIFTDMLGLYKAISGMISEIIAKDGMHFFCLDIYGLTRSKGILMSKTPKVRQLRALKKDILKLMQTYISSVVQIEIVNENFIPPLLDAVLGDYQRNIAPSRDAEVLNLMGDVVKSLGVSLFFLLLPL